MKKLIIISAISCLVLQFTSCYTNKTLTTQNEYTNCMSIHKNEYVVDERNKVYSVITHSGDTTIFNKISPGKITPEGVVGLPQICVPYSEADSIIFNTKTLQSLWKDGKNYVFISQNSTGYVCVVTDTLTIPISNIEQVQVKKFSENATLAAVAIPVTGVVLFTGLAIHALNSIEIEFDW